MAIIDVRGLSYRYGRHEVLRDLDFWLPEGAFYALLGRNGVGKSTLLQILMGLRRAPRGEVRVLDTPVRALTIAQRATIGYVAEGQRLPGWMRLEQLEAYCAPLYPTWDRALADQLRDRFALDPKRKLRTMSRGDYMKAALLVSLAPRPRLLLMDEPFTGIDVVVKDELVRGLLGVAGEDGQTVVIASHDVGELELLCDWVGIMVNGAMAVSEPLEDLKARYADDLDAAGEPTLRELFARIASHERTPFAEVA